MECGKGLEMVLLLNDGAARTRALYAKKRSITNPSEDTLTWTEQVFASFEIMITMIEIQKKEKYVYCIREVQCHMRQ